MYLFINSCSYLRITKKYDGIHPDLKPYFQEFKNMYDYMGSSKYQISQSTFDTLSIGFKDYSDKEFNIIGTCNYQSNEIDINRRWWQGFHTPYERVQLLYHEFGHCLLKRGHSTPPRVNDFFSWVEGLAFKLNIFKDKGYLKDGCPASFMHPYTLDDYCIYKHYNYYMSELFGSDKNINYMSYVYVRDNYDLKCGEVEVINKTETWNEIDQKTFENAKVRCLDMYDSCMSKFMKVDDLTYRVLCK